MIHHRRRLILSKWSLILRKIDSLLQEAKNARLEIIIDQIGEHAIHGKPLRIGLAHSPTSRGRHSFREHLVHVKNRTHGITPTVS